MSQVPTPSLIAELEIRQDEALQSLADLEQRIEWALALFGGISPAMPKSSKVGGKLRGEALPAAEAARIELKLHHPQEALLDSDDSAAA